MSDGRSGIPFRTNIAVESRDRDFDIIVEPIDLPTEDQVTVIDNVLELFGRTAALGMFSGALRSPARSTMSRLVAVGGGWHSRLQMPELDPGGFLVLLNLMVRIHYRHAELRRFVVAPTSGRGRPLDVDALNYPRTIDDPGFEWSIEESDHPAKNRLIDIEFRRALDDRQIDEVLGTVADWEALVRLGGFARDFDTLREEDELLGGEGYPVHSSIIEYSIDWIEASDAAYIALVKLIARLHTTLASVEHVVVT
jgi:hypothetical protein